MYHSKLLIGLLFVLPLFSQTKTDVTQIKATTSNSVVFVAVPGVGFIPALLGPNLVLTNNNGIFTLDSKFPTINVVFKNEITKTTTGFSQNFKTNFSVTGGKENLSVYRNGLLQTENEDYTVVINADNTITATFLSVIPTGDLIRLKYL